MNRSGSPPPQVDDERSNAMKAHGQPSWQGETSRTLAWRVALQPAVGRGLHSVGKGIHSATRQGGSQGSDHEARNATYVPALVCNPPLGGRVRHSHCARVARPQGRAYHDGLHACVESWWPWSPESSGRAINESVPMGNGITRSLEKRLFGATASCCASYRGFPDSFGPHFIPTSPSHLPF